MLCKQEQGAACIAAPPQPQFSTTLTFRERTRYQATTWFTKHIRDHDARQKTRPASVVWLAGTKRQGGRQRNLPQ